MDTFRAALGHSLPRASADKIAFVLGGGGQDMGGELTGRVLGVEVRRQEHDPPSLAPGPRKEPSEVCDGAGHSIEAHRKQRIGLGAIQASKRSRETRTLKVLGAVSLIGDQLQIPAAALGLSGERGTLRVEACAFSNLLVG